MHFVLLNLAHMILPIAGQKLTTLKNYQKSILPKILLQKKSLVSPLSQVKVV
jgi:hypothetical protein